jgi:hypothetical protein
LRDLTVGNIVNLFKDPHRSAQELLAWYATDRLDADERAAVAAHLEECAACRDDLQVERRLAAAVAQMALPCDPRWTQFRRMLTEKMRAPAIRPHRRLRSKLGQQGRMGRPGSPGNQAWLGWLLAGQAAIAALVVMALAPRSPPATEVGAPYRTLGSAAVAPSGNAIVIFRPDTTEAALRATLVNADARLVDGPTASGAYVLNIAPAARDARIAELRRQPAVVLAQPIDPQPLAGAGR